MTRVRLFQRKGIWWAAWTAKCATVRRSTRATDREAAEAVVNGWGDDLPEKVAFSVTEVGSIYFIEAGEFVKVGWARRGKVGQRVYDLQIGCPLPMSVVRTIPGTMRDERAIHRQLANHRVRGEWFRRQPVLDWLAVNHP